MCYKCAVSGEHCTGKPVKVVTKKREVRYEHHNGTSIGWEIARESLVHPSSAPDLGDPFMAPETKVVVDKPYRKPDRFAKRENVKPQTVEQKFGYDGFDKL
jgi:hypothetical protein